MTVGLAKESIHPVGRLQKYKRRTSSGNETRHGVVLERTIPQSAKSFRRNKLLASFPCDTSLCDGVHHVVLHAGFTVESFFEDGVLLDWQRSSRRLTKLFWFCALPTCTFPLLHSYMPPRYRLKIVRATSIKCKMLKLFDLSDDIALNPALAGVCLSRRRAAS